VTAFVILCAVMLAGAVACIVWPLWRTPLSKKAGEEGADRRARVSALVSLVALPVAAAAIYAGISNYPWREPQRLDEPPLAADATPEQVAERLARHLEDSPNDVDSWRLLGRAYAVMGRRESSIDALQKAYDIGGERDVNIGLELAEALVFADNERFDARAEPLLANGLAADPGNARALWYSGVIAMRRQDVESAKGYWTAMLAQNPPPHVREILVRQLVSMGATPESLGAAAPATGAPAEAPASGGRTIDLRVDIDPALRSRLRPGAALFVSARQLGVGGPPLAAVRTTADTLPVTVQLSDANAMIEGRNLSSVDEVEITARVAFGGTATTTAGDLIGRVLHRRDDAGTLAIRIDTVAD
jgi:cytochrome c-type biogenesis protein CcmH